MCSAKADAVIVTFNVEVLIKGTAERKKYGAADAIGALIAAKAQIRVHYLLYAAKVGYGDLVFIIEQFVKTINALGKTCQCAVRQIYTAKLYVGSHKHYPMRGGLKVVLVCMQLYTELGVHEHARALYEHLEHGAAYAYHYEVIDKTHVVHTIAAGTEPRDNKLIEERHKEVHKKLRGKIAYRHTEVVCIAKE